MIFIFLISFRSDEKSKQPSAAIADNESYCSTGETDSLALLSDLHQININSLFHSIASMLPLSFPSGYNIIKVTLRESIVGYGVLLFFRGEIWGKRELLSCMLFLKGNKTR